jgi:outer membrane protein assembly factor BamB
VSPYGAIIAAAFEDGEEIWKGHLLNDWEAVQPGWGVAQSPLLWRNQLIIAPWGKKAAVVALNKNNGQPRWKTPNPRGIKQDYSSVVPMELCGREMLVASGQQGRTIGVDPRSGKELWFYSGYKCSIHIPSPLAVGDDRIFLTGGYGAGSAMFKVTLDNGNYSTKTLWKNRNMGSQIAQPLLHGQLLFGNSNNTNGGLTCLSLDGEIRWQTGSSPGFDIGNLLIADGKIYIVHGGNGELVMAAAQGEAYRELGRSPVLSGSQVWGALAFADGLLLLRDQSSIVCVDLR